MQEGFASGHIKCFTKNVLPNTYSVFHNNNLYSCMDMCCFIKKRTELVLNINPSISLIK